LVVGDLVGRRQSPAGVVVPVQRQALLLEAVLALRARRRLAHLLDGWQQQADEYGDNRDHDQQLDQRERAPTATTHKTPQVAPGYDGRRRGLGGRARCRSRTPVWKRRAAIVKRNFPSRSGRKRLSG